MEQLKDIKYSNGNIQVVDTGEYRELFIDGACQGRINTRTKRIDSWYMNLITSILGRPDDRRFLFIGGGAMLLPTLYKSNKAKKVEVYEPNDSLYQLASDYFFFNKDYIVKFIKWQDSLDTGSKFDGIVVDAINGYKVDKKCYDWYACERYYNLLDTNGILAMNYISDSDSHPLYPVFDHFENVNAKSRYNDKNALVQSVVFAKKEHN